MTVSYACMHTHTHHLYQTLMFAPRISLLHCTLLHFTYHKAVVQSQRQKVSAIKLSRCCLSPMERVQKSDWRPVIFSLCTPHCTWPAPGAMCLQCKSCSCTFKVCLHLCPELQCMVSLTCSAVGGCFTCTGVWIMNVHITLSPKEMH